MQPRDSSSSASWSLETISSVVNRFRNMPHASQCHVASRRNSITLQVDSESGARSERLIIIDDARYKAYICRRTGVIVPLPADCLDQTVMDGVSTIRRYDIAQDAVPTGSHLFEQLGELRVSHRSLGFCEADVFMLLSGTITS